MPTLSPLPAPLEEWELYEYERIDPRLRPLLDHVRALQTRLRDIERGAASCGRCEERYDEGYRDGEAEAECDECNSRRRTISDDPLIQAVATYFEELQTPELGGGMYVDRARERMRTALEEAID